MANSWTIKGKRKVGDVEQIVDIVVVHELELHDEWMAECFLTVSVKSAEPIDFSVGDYIDYRGERYTIEYDPTVLKKARKSTYGEGFTYDNIKFVNEAQAKIVRCDFTDIVLGPDNQQHYTSLPTFPFYCETVDDLLDRIQANLEVLYPGEFTIIGMNTYRNAQRGNDYDEEYRKWIDPTGTPSDAVYGKVGVAETVDNINCWEALTKVHSDFALNFIVRGYTVVVGTAGMFTASKFRYGKGNGLYEIERIGDSEQQIVTRLKAYGSENNIPTNYYANLHRKATFVVSGKVAVDSQTAGDTSKFYYLNTDILWSTVKNAFTTPMSGIEAQGWQVTLSAGNVTVQLMAGGNAKNQDGVLYLTIFFGNSQTVPAFYDAVSVGTEVTITDGADVSKWPSDLVKAETGYTYPASLVMNRLMLPGFPDESLYDWALENGWTSVDAAKGEVAKDGVSVRLSKDEMRPYIDSLNTDVYGIRPGSIYFDGSGDTEEILPTIKGTGVDQIASAEQINDSGVYTEGEVPNFNITLPDLGFDLSSVWESGAAIEMIDGMCGGRSFEIVGRPSQNANQTWTCKCKRDEDSSLHLWFPYCDFQINANGRHDYYVLTGIKLPKAYVENASARLFDAAIDALIKNHAPRFTYQPRIDEIWMQRQDDAAKAAVPPTTSIHDTLKAGDIFLFEDVDLGIDAAIIIDVLTIKENGNNGIPTYEVTLRDEKQVSTIQKIQNKVDSLANGGNGIGSGGGGSSMTNAQIESLISSAGEDLFISKQHDDRANGLITFLKGIKIGLQRLFGWDAEGNITANDITANDVNVGGLLTSLRAKINELFSSNYSGSGIFESGWLLTNNHNGHSYLEIDELLVRMKAVFMELEIRKETYSGGNVFYSPAGSIIYRVEPQDENNQPLGQRTIETVRPWSWSRRLLGLFGLSKIGLFSHKHIIKIQDDVDPLLVHHYRCYLIADDGTVQTRNWWHDNDQARCQTFNRASEKHSTDQSDQTNPNFDDNYVQRNMDGNRFFWRLVTNVGSTKLEDGKWYDYVDLDNFTPDDGYVRGSDVPVAGDSIVCIGNRVEEERMNMIMLEVIGEDAPAIKIYKGINSFSFDGRKYMNVSPKKIQLRSGSIEYISDNGQILPPKMSRGAWVSGVRYHYYDEVSHSGSTWLCIIVDGYRWEDAQGNIIENESLIGEIRAGEGLFVYGTDSHGEDLKDRYYSIGTYDDALVYKVRKYTINEPSDLHAAEWQKEVSAGGSGVRGSFKSRVFARTNTNIATEYYTPTGGSYEYPWPGGENPHTYRGVTWHDGVPAGKEILWSSVCTFYGAGGSSEWSTPSPETDTADLDIEFSPSLTKPLPPMVGANDTPPTTPTGTKINGDSTHGSRANGSDSEADWYDTNKDADNEHADWENAKWRAERKISNGVYDGEWVVTKIKGEDGDGIPGDFQSTAFCRTNTDLSSAIVSGGSYTSPIPTSTTINGQTIQISWDDGIPNGEAMLWATTRTFYGDGSTSDWDSPRKMMDTQNYDVEFAFLQDPDVQPDEPDDNNRHKPGGYYEGQIWFDPILDNPLPAGTSGTWSDMVWRAERETINGVQGTWVITRIKGEKGEIDPSQIPQEWVDEVIDQASKALQEGLSIIISPQVIFVRQDTEGDVVFDNATADVEVYKSDVLQQFSIPSGQLVTDTIKAFGKTDAGYIEMQNCASAEAVSNDPSHPTANTLWRVKLTGIENVYNQEKREYEYSYDNGYIRFKVNVTVVTDDTTTPPTTTTKSYWMKVAWYLNRLGNRTTKMWGDIEQTYMSRREYQSVGIKGDATTNLLLHTINPDQYIGDGTNGTWNNSGNTDLAIVTLTESPVDGYNKAFRIGKRSALISASWYQICTFWSSIATYRFSCYARGINASQTAMISMSQPTHGGGEFTKTFSVGTGWQYITFDVTIPGYKDSVDTGIFYLGISGIGTIEYVAPTVVDITSPSVIRKDYEGQIETSATGIDTKFTEITDNIIDGENGPKPGVSSMSQLTITANGLNSRVTAVEASTTKNMVDYSGWEYYTGGLAETDESTQKIYGSNNQNDFCSPAVYLRDGVTYVFSVYCSTKPQLYVCFCEDNPEMIGNDVQFDITIPSGSIKTVSGDTYRPEGSSIDYARYYGSFTPEYGTGYYKMNPYSQTYFYRPQLETGEEPSQWVNCNSKNYSSEIKQTADNINLSVNSGLMSTGIDIENRKITLDAENTVATGNFYAPKVISENDDMITTIAAGQLTISSKRTASYGRFAINELNEIVLQMYDQNGKMVVNLGGTPDTSISAKWTNVNLRYLGSTAPTPSIANLTANAPGSSTKPCETRYQLTLGKQINGTQVYKYFYPTEQGGGEVLRDDQKAMDGRYFTSKTMDTPISTNYYITSGFYVKQNNGVFMRKMNAQGQDVYTCDVYKITSGNLLITQTVEFTS